MHMCMNCDRNRETRKIQTESYGNEVIEMIVCSGQPADQHAPKGGGRSKVNFIAEQSKDAYCLKMTTHVGLTGSDFYIDCNQILFQTSISDGCLQKLMPVLLRKRILPAECQAPVAGHKPER